MRLTAFVIAMAVVAPAFALSMQNSGQLYARNRLQARSGPPPNTGFLKTVLNPGTPGPAPAPAAPAGSSKPATGPGSRPDLSKTTPKPLRVGDDRTKWVDVTFNQYGDMKQTPRDASGGNK